jgi:hypothetical protein
VRVNPNGRKVYRCMYRHGKTRRFHTIGNAELMTLPEAREKALAILGIVAQGALPDSKRQARKSSITFSDFLLREYAPWRVSNRKGGQAEINRLKTNFLARFGEWLPILPEKGSSKLYSNVMQSTDDSELRMKMLKPLVGACDWLFG